MTTNARVECSFCKKAVPTIPYLHLQCRTDVCNVCTDTMPDLVRIYSVPSGNLQVLKDKFVKLARRARKLNLPEPTFREIGTERKIVDSNVYLIHLIVVDPGANVVRVCGWTFTATIQHTEEGNIIRNAGKQDVPVQYRTGSQLCEHCNTSRYRKDTYILHNETTGVYKQVGRNCLSDFFGHDALMYAEQAQYLCDISDACDAVEGGAGSVSHYDCLELYLPHVAECIRLDGWMSRGRARSLGLDSHATCEVAMAHLHPIQRELKNRRYTTVSDDSVGVSDRAIEWASGLEGEDLSDYLHNIRTVARTGVVDRRSIGLAASIVAAYQRHTSQLQFATRLARRAETARHIGTVGEKGIFNVTVEKVIQCETVYGISHLHIMGDADGNVFVWFSKNVLETGRNYVLKGTIKAHNERNGIRQNVLTRCDTVEYRNYIVVVGSETYRFQAESETDVRKMLRERLNVSKLPRGLTIQEEKADAVPDVVDEATFAIAL